jgi:hypothetical protein
MKKHVIYDGQVFRITSYGNGVSYVFENVPQGRLVYFQGDDAAHFADELEALADWRSLTELWDDYAEVSQCV